MMSACQIGGGIEPSVTTLVLPYEAKIASCTTYSFEDNANSNIILGEARGDMLLVGFAPGLSREAQERVLAQYPFFDRLDGEVALESGNITKVLLHPDATCFEAEKMLKMLQKQDEVVFATPAFHPKPSEADAYQWVGLSNEILVSVESPEALEQLEHWMKKTKSTLVLSLSDELHLISADKNSKGNALELSSSLNQLAFVAAAEPNLIYSLTPINGQDAEVQSVRSKLP